MPRLFSSCGLDLPALALFPLLACAVLMPGTALAHPHIYVECAATFVFDDNGLAGSREQWVFDELFTATILDIADTNRNGVMDPEEIPVARQEAFSNLANYNYFNSIHIDGSDFPVREITDFDAWMRDDGKVTYRFFIPCPVAAGDAQHEVKVAVYDQSFFVFVAYGDGNSGFDPFADAQFADSSAPADPTDFSRFVGDEGAPVPPDSVPLEGPVEKFSVQDTMQAAPDMKYFFDQIVPDAFVLVFATQ